MMRSKIQLSPAEMALVTNAEVILTKNRVLGKLKQLLEDIQAQMVQESSTFSKPHIFQVPPKISRGENYLGLPYLVLDYPRVFQREAVCAVRSFFWWGHFFSSTLQLSGEYKTAFLPRLETAYPTFSNYHIGIRPDPWHHNFDPGNYTAIAGIGHGDFKKLLHQHPSVKIATKLPVADWPQAAPFLFDNWKFYLDTLLA